MERLKLILDYLKQTKDLNVKPIDNSPIKITEEELIDEMIDIIEYIDDNVLFL